MCIRDRTAGSSNHGCGAAVSSSRPVGWGGVMRLGMLTACLPSWPLEKIAAWAATAGYESLEVAVWPSVGGREFEASHLPVASFGGADAEATRVLLDLSLIHISEP